MEFLYDQERKVKDEINFWRCALLVSLTAKLWMARWQKVIAVLKVSRLVVSLLMFLC